MEYHISLNIPEAGRGKQGSPQNILQYDAYSYLDRKSREIDVLCGIITDGNLRLKVPLIPQVEELTTPPSLHPTHLHVRFTPLESFKKVSVGRSCHFGKLLRLSTIATLAPSSQSDHSSGQSSIN